MNLLKMSKKYCLSENEVILHSGAAIYGLKVNCPSFQLYSRPGEDEFYLSLYSNGVVSDYALDDHSYYYASFIYSDEFTKDAKELLKDVLNPKDSFQSD